MQNLDLEKITEQVRSLAVDAGTFLRNERKTFDRGRVEEKGAHDYVSYVDKESEKRIVKRLQTKSTEDPCFFHALFLFSVFQLRHLLFSRIGFAVFAFALYNSENTSPIFPSIKSTPPRSRAGAPRLMTTMCSPPK